MLKNFDEVKRKASSGKLKRLVVADAAHGESIVEALKGACEAGLIEPILVGEEANTRPLVEKTGLEGVRYIDISGPKAIAQKSVELIRGGEADMIMKGKIDTPTFMRAILDKENGLRKGKLLSHVAAVEVAGYPKLMLVTDGGIVIDPGLEEKIEIIKNAVDVASGIGVEEPKVAAMAAIEKLTEKQPETLHAAELTKMAERGQLGNIVVEGPVAADVLLSREAAKAKKIDSDMTLDADIVLVPSVVTGNVFVKGLIYLADAKVGGLVMGAKCPIVLLSRSDTAEIKLCSIALACAIA